MRQRFEAATLRPLGVEGRERIGWEAGVTRAGELAVRFRETLIALADRGIETFEEIGPGSVLSGLVKRTIQRAAA